LTGKLDSLPWQEWSEDDRNDLANALMGVRDRAGEILAAMGKLSNEEEKESELPRRNLS